MIERTNIKDWTKYWWIFPLLLLGAGGCSPILYPVGKPFVYKTNITLKADLPNERRKEIEEQLYNYIDDSLKVQTKAVLGFKRQVNPPIFDSANIDRSKTFMKSYLNSLGYYRAAVETKSIKYDTVTVKVYQYHRFLNIFKTHSSTRATGYRTTISLVVNADKQLKFDSIWYDLKVPELEQLALETQSKALMKKGEGYSKQVVGQELDRLIALYRSKGYFKITRSSLSAEFDSTDKALVSLENDPFAVIEQATSRRLNPTVDFRIFQRQGADSSSFLKYKVGKMIIFPETRIDEDHDELIADSSLVTDTGRRGVLVRYKTGKFTTRTIRRFNSLVPGKLYNEEDYFKTFNAFSQVGSWQQVDVKAVTYMDSTDTVPKVDINLFLTPARKFSTKVDLEGSQNIGRNAVDVLTGSFFGLSVVGNLLNRNFAHNAIQWNSNLRGGVEISTNRQSNSYSSIFQTILFSAGTTFSIPRLWPPFRWLIKRPDGARTFLSVSGAYNDRKDFYVLRNLNLSLGYEWKKKNNIWTFKLPNIEFVDLERSDSLQKLIDNDASLTYAFNQGLVFGISGTWQRNIYYRKKPNVSSYLRVSAEESGLLSGGFLFKGQILRFYKMDGEFRHNIVFAKHKYAFRFVAGYGRDYSSGSKSLPFFRQFIAGGPNSLRAWRLRQLGLGNSFTQDTATFKDRLGDIYLETNAEYRFHMFKIVGFPVEGALFADLGNVWSRVRPSNAPVSLTEEDGVFRLRHLYRDLALAAGYGIRWDFSYLRVRLDIAYRVKDPVRAGNGWIKTLEYKTPNRPGLVENKNYAIQFGIDYPF